LDGWADCFAVEVLPGSASLHLRAFTTTNAAMAAVAAARYFHRRGDTME